MTQTVLRHVVVVDTDGLRVNQRVEVRNGRFHAVGPDGDGALSDDDRDLSGMLLIPGLIDLHNHGAQQIEYVRATAKDAATAVDYHLRHGTTSLLMSIGSANRETMSAAARVASELADVANSSVVGVHLEGPYLSHDRRGAHPPAELRDASLAELEEFWESSAGLVRVLTFAPERDHAEVAFQFCIDHGIVPTFGHSAADYALAEAWFSRGVRHVTHGTNAMNQIDRREPGPIPAALNSSSVTFELIADGIHVHPAVISLLARAADPQQIVLVTDASSVTGLEDGRYAIGGRDIVARDGGVYVGDTNTVAGSRITLFDALRNCVHVVGLSLTDAVRMATINPARVIGLDSRKGRIRPGFDADYLLITESLELREVNKAVC